MKVKIEILNKGGLKGFMAEIDAVDVWHGTGLAGQFREAKMVRSVLMEFLDELLKGEEISIETSTTVILISVIKENQPKATA